MKVTFSHIIAAAAAVILLSACNKDDVIGDPDTPAEDHYRPATVTSSAYATSVLEYRPAPGQFINDTSTGGMTGNETSQAHANSWALQRLSSGHLVSLGAFGGYIVVGFDHSIVSSAGDYDFAVIGNAFLNANSANGGSNEPGIVYVMQDSNGNGLADDTWYELRGSETGRPETISNYEVTYYRPSSPESDVEWKDNLGNTGCVKYVGMFHSQQYYYPAWIAEDSYTLKGTCLSPQSSQDPETGMWNNHPYGWGYADNLGSDNFKTDAASQCNRFRIADAVDSEEKSVKLSFIDFVKIQTGVNANIGALGEISTEVCGVFDLSLKY